LRLAAEGGSDNGCEGREHHPDQDHQPLVEIEEGAGGDGCRPDEGYEEEVKEGGL